MKPGKGFAAAAAAAAVLTVLRIGSLAYASADNNFGNKNSFQQLVDAINQANSNAQACNNAPGCLGQGVTLTLRSDAILGGPLPPLQNCADLTLIGDCNAYLKRCTIDGTSKYSIFTSSAPNSGGAGRLDLVNLDLRNANGGVLVNLWSEVIATGSVFENNVGGAVLSQGAFGGFPPHTYDQCAFINNYGTAVTAGNAKDQLSTGNPGMTFNNTVFIANTGSNATDAEANGGAINIAGGKVVFEDVLFVGNVAQGSGGAVFADTATLLFRRTQFTQNRALSGDGGAVAGQSGFFGNFTASFCSSGFTGNSAPSNSSSDSLYFAAPYPGNDTVTVAFCNAEIPSGTVLVPEPGGKVIDGEDDQCYSDFC